jgi:hypothetical protein
MTVTIFVPDVPEFQPLLRSAGAMAACTVSAARNGYWRIEAPRELRFVRKELGLGPALWNSALSGGFKGRIMRYDRDEMSLMSEDVPA